MRDSLKPRQSRSPRLERRALVAKVLAAREDALVVAGLGAPAWDVTAAGDDVRNFYLWGGMGQAAMIGLGLALAQPKRRVLVVTGDGELLMSAGALAVIGAERPSNLGLLVIDNEAFGETGGQPGIMAAGCDLAAVARGFGFTDAATVRTLAEVKALPKLLFDSTGPVLAIAKVAKTRPPLVLPSRDGVFLTHRFREAVLGRNDV